MSDSNDKNFMTTIQIKKKLKAIDTDKKDIKNSLLSILDEFHCLETIAKSIGLVRKGGAFVNRISWDTVLSSLEQPDKTEANVNAEDIKLDDIIETVAQSSNQLEHELIPQLQKWRNNWMFEVILLECVILGLVTLVIAGVTHLQGLWSFTSTTVSVQPLLYERPIFSLITSFILLFSLILMHFSIRNFVAKKLVGKLKNERSEFDLAGAFLKNTRVQHSIFRPDIIGWGWFSKKCLLNHSNGI